MSLVIPTCPTDCSSLVPEVSFNICAPNVNYGEIDFLYIGARDAGGLVDWTSLAEWLTRISNTSVAADAIRQIGVIGSKPAPTRESIEISGNRKVWSPATHTIAIAIDETNDENYEFLRTLECNGFYKMWYSAGKYLYGGNDGIDVDQMFLDDIIPESRKELDKFIGAAEWEAQFHPERILNPLA